MSACSASSGSTAANDSVTDGSSGGAAVRYDGGCDDGGPAAARRHRPRTTRQRRWSERTDCPWRGCRARTTGAAVSLLAGGLLAVAGLEAGHTATGVEDLLLARVERVAGAAHVGADLAGRLRAARHEGVPTGAGHLGDDVLGVDTRLHGFLLGVTSPGQVRLPHL